MTTGEHVGPYLIEAAIGEGGMGAVYRARDTRLDRTVALKVSKAEFSERFAGEARAIAALNHPNICTLHDVGPNYLVMEHIEGTPLKGPLPVEKAVEYAGQILDALDAAHRKGLTHRDLKPANILVTKQGIKLLDFGLAKQTAPLQETDATLTKALTGEGQIVGTLQYMSPEQLQGKSADARSDLFAFGCVLYELLSGKRAFQGTSAASVIAAILEREPAPLDLHPPLGRVIAKCLAKDPDERFQTARDLKYNLALAMEPHAAVKAKANRWPWISAAAALVIGTLGVWGLTRSSKAPVDEQVVRLQLNPPEGGRFDQTSLAVSPDGRMLAYVAIAPGKRGLWVRSLDGTSARLLPGTDGAISPFWSPDARFLGYFGSGKLWRIDVASGAPIAISDTLGNTYGDAWGADGMIVFGSSRGPLHRVAASGGAPVPLTALNASRGESAHSWPQLLPGGKAVVFFVRAAKPEDTGIYATRLDHPQEHVRLVPADSNALFAAGHLLWRRGSTLVAQRFDPDALQLSGEPQPVTDPVGSNVSAQMVLAASAGGVLLSGSSNGGINQLTWMDRAGQPVGTVGPVGVNTSFSFSPDGRRAVVSKAQGSGSDLWTVDLDRNVMGRLTFVPGISNYPVWAPDGHTIVFRSGSPLNLFRKDAGGAGAEERISTSANRQWPTDWSRDGRSLLYYEVAPETKGDLWVLTVTPDGKPAGQPRPYLRTAFNERFGRFSPEPSPRWVAYDSDESGRPEVYIRAYPEPKGKWQISDGGGQYPAWSPDGREIFYVSADSKLMAVKLKVDADAVAPSAPVALFEVDVQVLSPPYSVSPDGKRFLVRVPVESAGQPLEVILNWPALLKKGVE